MSYKSFEYSDHLQLKQSTAVKNDRIFKPLQNKMETNNLSEFHIIPNMIIKRSKRAIDQVRIDNCDKLSKLSIKLQATNEMMSATAAASAAIGIMGAAGAIGASMAASVISYAKMENDLQYLNDKCDDIPFDEIKDILDERFNRIDEKLEGISVNYKAIQEVDKKIDRNFNLIAQVDYKVDRLLYTTQTIEKKVDRNLNAIRFGFKDTKHALDKGLTHVINYVKNSKIEYILAKIKTFIEYFNTEKQALKYLTENQIITKLEENTLDDFRNSRNPQSVNSLHTLLNDIIHQRFAIPENVEDDIAFVALVILCTGVKVYISVLYFLIDGYDYLARKYYEKRYLDKYNKYLTMQEVIYNDFKNSLSGNNGLIATMMNILNEITELKYIKLIRTDILKFSTEQILFLNNIKSKLSKEVNTTEPFILIKKYDFSVSGVNTPIGKWENGKNVRYCIQFKIGNSYSHIGTWSVPYKVNKKANPSINIGTVDQEITRFIFRQIDNSLPELVGIIQHGNQSIFRDVDRDMYNAAMNPNENVAMQDIHILIQDGADINAMFENGRQAIHAATIARNHNVILQLLKTGASINAKDSKNFTALHLMVQMGDEIGLKLLTTNEADINAKTSQKWTPLHIAILERQDNLITSLLNNGADVNLKAINELNPLHIAISHGYTDAAILLLNHHGTDISIKSKNNMSSLHLASIGGNYKLVNIILENNKTDLNALADGDLTALHFAVLSGDVETVNTLLKKSNLNINKKCNENWTPLHMSIILEKENITTALLKDIRIDTNTIGNYGLTPLHLAASNGMLSTVASLVDEGISLNMRDHFGNNPLHIAIEQGHLEVIKFLVEKGAPVNVQQNDLNTPVGIAVLNGHTNVVKYLIDNGADVNIKNNIGMTAIDIASWENNLTLVEIMINKFCIYKLHFAAYKGHMKIISFLVRNDYDVNEIDIDWTTPVHEATRGGHFDVVNYLIEEKQAKFNIKDKFGNTPLHLASLNGHLELLKYFIGKGISPKDIDIYENTLLHLASRNGHLKLIKYLIEEVKNGY